MPEQFYKEALKLGQKEKRQCVSKGQYPYLPILEEVVSKERLASGRRLGVMQIPAEFIVGTKNEGRTNAFAANFMPLLSESTEFAEKWKRLCDAHLEEGIREPVKVCEYMNRYYVEEGNKRVSVLKFFGAVSIPAQVTRILPPTGEAEELKLYYEFLSFYEVSKINYIEFSRLGSYQKLQKLYGKSMNDLWSEEEQSAFRAGYYYFKHLFEEMGGEKLKCTTADALLVFLHIYGVNALKEKSGDEIRQAMQSVWEEFQLLQEPQAIDLKLSPEETKKKSLLERVFGEDRSVVRAAFIYDKTPTTSGWTYGHELGRQYVQNVFEGKLITTAYGNAMKYQLDAVIRQAVEDGNKIIFTTSPKLLKASLAAAVENPEVVFFNCSLNKSHRYIRTYYARMYEVRFIIGAIAGVMSEGKDVGFICDYPIVGQIAGINAFAIGVLMTNPKAKIYLEWSSVQGIYVAIARLRKRGISIISAKDLARADGFERNSFGLFRFDENGHTNLAMPVWHWGVYYEKLIQGILNRTLQLEYESSNKALNYYWGMSAGVAELICSQNLPESVRRLAELLKESICTGLFSPFSGPIRTQSGRIVDPEGQGLGLEQIISMDWLSENIVGEIPSYDQLSEEGKETVESAGAPL